MLEIKTVKDLADSLANRVSSDRVRVLLVNGLDDFNVVTARVFVDPDTETSVMEIRVDAND